MRVTLNGEARELRDGAHRRRAGRASSACGARRIAVEINLDILARDDYARRALRDGDVVEIVHFIGGG